MELKQNSNGLFLFFPITSQSAVDLERIIDCLDSNYTWDLRPVFIDALQKMSQKLKEGGEKNDISRISQKQD